MDMKTVRMFVMAIAALSYVLTGAAQATESKK